MTEPETDLRRLADGSADKHAVWRLWERCFVSFNSDEVTEEATWVVGRLMEPLAIPGLPRRALILRLLGEVASGTGPHAQTARAAMVAGLGTLTGLLDDPKRKVAMRAVERIAGQ
ncbi:hypothetical protein ACIBEJ_18150 [Nonomuraea sp. NPDC050790]|uniref:hypothetical protein n=1 Tax=Nonomuraea sp. NPDC050790 TaxID=3364371 RepID=UPI003791E07D